MDEIEAVSACVEALAWVQRAGDSLEEAEAEFAKAIEERQAAYVWLARTFSCPTCKVREAVPCQYGGRESRDLCHQARENLARARLKNLGVNDQ